MALTDEQKDRAVELYLSENGEQATTADIYQETGVSRPALYMILRQRGIEPRRQRRAAPPGVDVVALIERLEAQGREIGRLRKTVESNEERIAELEAQLTLGAEH